MPALLRALKYLSPNNVFIFHDDETGKKLNFFLPTQHRKSRKEAWSRKQPPSTFLQRSKERHMARVYRRGGSFCQAPSPPAPKPSSCPFMRKAPGLLATENSPLLRAMRDGMFWSPRGAERSHAREPAARFSGQRERFPPAPSALCSPRRNLLYEVTQGAQRRKRKVMLGTRGWVPSADSQQIAGLLL